MSDALTVSMKDRVEKARFPEQALSFLNAYCKILKIGPGAYIFQRLFLRGSFLEGLIFERGLFTYSMGGNSRFKNRLS